jgi:hypothetical protein
VNSPGCLLLEYFQLLLFIAVVECRIAMLNKFSDFEFTSLLFLLCLLL